jgi:uncharacterized membrane protein YjfL (UPF0719 family)
MLSMKTNKFEKFIRISTWAVSLAVIGGLIGLILPLIIYQNAQAGLVSVFYGAPFGLLIGMSAGMMIGAYRTEKKFNNDRDITQENKDKKD